MTSRDHARRAGHEGRAVRLGAYGDDDQALTPRPSLPDRLAAARERKGVDLTRVERDTKIRARYLSALERGDYRDLPGAVYTKGFLRNYAIYLSVQLLRYAKPPEVTVMSPSPASITVADDATTFRITGTATPGALISV